MTKANQNTNLWRPIETAPRDGTDILIYSPEMEGCAIALASALEDDEEDESKKDHDLYDTWYDTWGDGTPMDVVPTHWMPLPTIPIVRL